MDLYLFICIDLISSNWTSAVWWIITCLLQREYWSEYLWHDSASMSVTVDFDLSFLGLWCNIKTAPRDRVVLLLVSKRDQMWNLTVRDVTILHIHDRFWLMKFKIMMWFLIYNNLFATILLLRLSLFSCLHNFIFSNSSFFLLGDPQEDKVVKRVLL